jgi:hypothetical protein
MTVHVRGAGSSGSVFLFSPFIFSPASSPLRLETGPLHLFHDALTTRRLAGTRARSVLPPGDILFGGRGEVFSFPIFKIGLLLLLSVSGCRSTRFCVVHSSKRITTGYQYRDRGNTGRRKLEDESRICVLFRE